MTFDNHQVLLVRKDGRAGSRAEDTHVSPPDPLINRGQGTIISQVQGATHPNEISADLSFFFLLEFFWEILIRSKLETHCIADRWRWRHYGRRKQVSAKVVANIFAKKKGFPRHLSILSEKGLSYFEKLHEIDQIMRQDVCGPESDETIG